jgi:uncharacterized protein YjbI with pentapeptide repeats
MNDSTKKPDLRPANENPWYCLATLHGEQRYDGISKDKELANKNVAAWNEWINTGPDDFARLAKTEELFARRTSLRLPKLGSSPDFSHTHFDHIVDFERFQFTRKTTFRSAKFSCNVSFSGALFAAEADFALATFAANANFAFSHFKYADFLSAVFSAYADFESTTFSGASSFSSAVFTRTADFRSAKFHGGAQFNWGTFSGATNFVSATFSSTANFKGTRFSNSILFINAMFAEITNFVNARFEHQVPDFRGATMHEATEWHGATWPKPPDSRLDAQGQVYAYERLKQEMERLKKHEDEQNFFRRELRARRGLVRTLSGGWFLNLAYQALSAYGDSVTRPLLWMTGVFAVGTTIFARAPLYCGAPMPIKLAAKLSFANIFVFLPDKREIMMNSKMIECLSNTTQAVSAAQSLFSVVLLFLFGLALRNRFRMK